ncbi:MAG TPA: hypothetical protein VMS99_14285 [Acidimicrobiia bacterium]|nr:hypothetical protein [Acidimicrobiia bacterium]
MRVRTTVPAGILDAGFAALGAFAVSIYAARVLPTDTLGFYAVFFTAFLTAVQIPGQLLLLPYEIHAMTLDRDKRMSVLRTSMIRGFGISSLASIGAAFVGFAITYAGGFGDPWPLTLTVMVAATVSPLQDHIRRMLHAAERSWSASFVSISQALSIALALGVLILYEVPPVWIPFTALALANVASTTFGVLLSRRGTRRLSEPLPPVSHQLKSGSWLLATGILGPLMGLVVNAIVIAVAGATILGLAEAARVVGRPILVINTGLGQALAPRSVAAAQRGQRRAARRVTYIFAAVTALGGGIYAGLVSFDWALNIAQEVIPKAYEISGLVLAVCISNIVVGISYPGRYELLGARREPWVTFTEVVGQAGRTGVAAAASVLGAFVIAIGDTVLGLVRIIGYQTKLPGVYRSEPVVKPESSPSEREDE